MRALVFRKTVRARVNRKVIAIDKGLVNRRDNKTVYGILAAYPISRRDSGFVHQNGKNMSEFVL
jgi:hypothetical protein